MAFLIIVGICVVCYLIYQSVMDDSPASQASTPSGIPGFNGEIPDPAVATEPYIDDPTLADEAWWRQSHERYESIRPLFIPGTVESYCQGGDIRLSLGDHGAAIYFYRRSIDHMHTEYLFSQMRDRTPNPNDRQPIDGYLRTLNKVREIRPEAPISEQVREVTHRLRTMATAAERRGYPAEVYHEGLQQLGQIAPDIDVSDIFWEPFGG